MRVTVHGSLRSIYSPSESSCPAFSDRVRIYVSEDLRRAGIKHIAQTHQHTQTRGRTEPGLDPNAVRHRAPAATLRTPRHVAAVAAVECGGAVRFAACRSS